MPGPRSTAASVCTFLLLVLVAAALSLLDLILTENPGHSWEASRSFVITRLWVDDNSREGEKEGKAFRYRATCTEIDGEVRVILLTGEEAGSVLEWHLLGFTEMELEGVDDDGGSDTDLSREWE